MDNAKRDIVIVDLDGTLALDEPRAERYLRGPEGKQWPQYFAACGDDEPNDAVIQLVRLLKYSGKRIYIFSGRLDSVLKETKEWLSKHNVPYDKLVMRPADNRIDDTILKLQWTVEHEVKDRIWLVLEDRQRMVDAWRKAGYTCLQVAPGNF